MVTASSWPREARAQGTDELATVRTQVSQLHSQGKYAEAAAIAERYVALAHQKRGDKHPQFAAAIAWLAAIYEAQGHYAEAEPLHKRALAIREKALGAEHPEFGESLGNIAVNYKIQGRYAE